MTALVVVSPHLDDAVLSVGQLLAGHPNAFVATLCTAPGDQAPSTGYDRQSGYPTAKAAMRGRRREDKAACELLGVTPLHLGLVDSAYNGGSTVAAMVQALRQAIDEVRGWDDEHEVVLCGPLGLLHPDHLKAHQAFMAQRAHVVETWLYEELPYRVENPIDTVARLQDVDRVHDLELGFLGTGPAELKDQAMAAYESQAWALNLPACRVPERLWRIA